jgi:hypothetical protein
VSAAILPPLPPELEAVRRHPLAKRLQTGVEIEFGKEFQRRRQFPRYKRQRIVRHSVPPSRSLNRKGG